MGWFLSAWKALRRPARETRRAPRRSRSLILEDLEGRRLLSRGIQPLVTLHALDTSNIISGPDGALWVGVNTANNPESSTIESSAIDRIGLDGSVTSFPVPAPEDANSFSILSLTTGPDGNLWFDAEGSSDSGPGGIQVFIGSMTPTGHVTEFPPIPVPAGDLAQSNGIVAGPGDALWFDYTVSDLHSPHRSQAFIGRVTTDGFVTLFSLSPARSRLPTTGTTIAVGADGNLWFVEDEGKSSVFGRMSPSGAVTQLLVGKTFGADVANGPTGHLIVTGRQSARAGLNEVFEVSTSGAIAPVRVPRAIRYAFLSYLGPADGSLWFTNALIVRVSKIGRLTASGVATSYDLPGRERQQGVESMAVGTDGDLYVLKNVYRGLINNSETVYRISPGELPPPRTGHGSHA